METDFKSRYADIDYRFIVELAIEALERSNMSNSPGHPEDLAAHLIPAIEAVAVGFGAGMDFAYRHPDPNWLLREADRIRSAQEHLVKDYRA